MQRKITLLFTVVLLFYGYKNLAAQEREPALAKVVYEFIHVNDTTQRDKRHQEKMVLYLGLQTTLFGSYASESAMEDVRQQMNDPGFDGNIVMVAPGRTTREAYYFTPQEQKLKQVYRVLSEFYMVDEEFPVFNWKIEENTKEIGGYTAQMATTQYKGRDYTAWFTTELPFQSGPWKFQGLPGLILEVADSREEVFFNYAGFDKIEAGSVNFGLPEKVIATDQKALDRLVEGVAKNPQAAMSARSQGGSSVGLVTNTGAASFDTSKIKSMTVRKAVDEGKTSVVDNNPLELTD